MPTTRTSAESYADKTRWNIYMPADRDTTTFDYGVAAELFMAKRKGGARQPLSYHRFATRGGGYSVRHRGTSGRSRAGRLDAGR